MLDDVTVFVDATVLVMMLVVVRHLSFTKKRHSGHVINSVEVGNGLITIVQTFAYRRLSIMLRLGRQVHSTRRLRAFRVERAGRDRRGRTYVRFTITSFGRLAAVIESSDRVP